jgi:hypothetical protein
LRLDSISFLARLSVPYYRAYILIYNNSGCELSVMGTALAEGGSARRATYPIAQPVFRALAEQPVQGSWQCQGLDARTGVLAMPRPGRPYRGLGNAKAWTPVQSVQGVQTVDGLDVLDGDFIVVYSYGLWAALIAPYS